ncbi:MAG: MATE family efflux transporter [Clostridiales bacterium]|nr:MATE family efflux transporter [Clostridiales bacterium]
MQFLFGIRKNERQLYNVCDALVVGNFVGKQALAAISSTGSLIFLLVGFFSGMFSGVGVVISRFFGAKDDDMIRKSVGNAVAFSIAAGIVLSLVGVIFTPNLLQLMGTPDSVFTDAVNYVRTYFGGMIFIVIYNAANGIFQAVGDSRHPLYYLLVSSITNVILDFIFVAFFDMGVTGAAIATVIAQAVSVFLAFWRLSHINEIYRLNIKFIRFNPYIIKQMLFIGLPAGIQNSVIALANVIVQSNINVFGDTAMAGCGSYSKIEGFAFIPIMAFSISMTTFISQNLGAKQYERAKSGARFGIITSCILAEIIGIIFYLFAPQLISLFNRDVDVIQIGSLQAHTITFFYFLLAFSHCLAGILRGAGKSTIPMFTMLICWCVIRVTYITIMTHYFKNIQVIFWAYPMTWALSSSFFLFYYKQKNIFSNQVYELKR